MRNDRTFSVTKVPIISYLVILRERALQANMLGLAQ
jgi:hypothetical protein